MHVEIVFQFVRLRNEDNCINHKNIIKQEIL